MSTKEKILNILNNNVGKYVSGEEIAKTIGISRNCVWKSINILKKEGYEISSHLSWGYILSKGADIFTSTQINSYLQRPRKIIIYDKASSSNTLAKEMCAQGEEEGTVIIVRSQTNGKGRMGRSFISSSQEGLYMTIILRPVIPAQKCVNITVLGAVALLEAIEETSGKACSIKWVNDIYIDEKKVAGILTEASIDFESSSLQYAVIGMGINIGKPADGFDKEISSIATSIYEKAPCGYKARLCAKIIERFFYHYSEIDKMEYIKKYREKSNIIGKDVSVYLGEKIINGVAIDIDNNANLVVKTDTGEEKFSSGEARVRKNEKSKARS